MAPAAILDLSHGHYLSVSPENFVCKPILSALHCIYIKFHIYENTPVARVCDSTCKRVLK